MQYSTLKISVGLEQGKDGWCDLLGVIPRVYDITLTYRTSGSKFCCLWRAYVTQRKLYVAHLR